MDLKRFRKLRRLPPAGWAAAPPFCDSIGTRSSVGVDAPDPPPRPSCCVVSPWRDALPVRLDRLRNRAEKLLLPWALLGDVGTIDVVVLADDDDISLDSEKYDGLSVNMWIWTRRWIARSAWLPRHPPLHGSLPRQRFYWNVVRRAWSSQHVSPLRALSRRGSAQCEGTKRANLHDTSIVSRTFNGRSTQPIAISRRVSVSSCRESVVTEFSLSPAIAVNEPRSLISTCRFRSYARYVEI